MEWNGDWSDNSSLWTEHLKQELSYKNENDGTFWMNFNDILQYFSICNICMCHNSLINKHLRPWIESRNEFEYIFMSNGHGLLSTQIYELIIPQNSITNDNINDNIEMYITIHQKDKRIIDSLPYIDIGVTILQELTIEEQSNIHNSSDIHNPSDIQYPSRKYRYIGSSGNSINRQNQLFIQNLKIGNKYLIIPTSTGCKMKQYMNECIENNILYELKRNCVLSIHSISQYFINKIDFQSKILEESIELPILNDGHTQVLIDSIENNEKVILYSYHSNNSDIISYLVNNQSFNKILRINMNFINSQNIITNCDSLINNEIIVEANDYEILHHIMPLNDNITSIISYNITYNLYLPFNHSNNTQNTQNNIQNTQNNTQNQLNNSQNDSNNNENESENTQNESENTENYGKLIEKYFIDKNNNILLLKYKLIINNKILLTFYIKSINNNRILFSFNFFGSKNYELFGEMIDLNNPLKAQIIAEPFERSNSVIQMYQIDCNSNCLLKTSISYKIENFD